MLLASDRMIIARMRRHYRGRIAFDSPRRGILPISKKLAKSDLTMVSLFVDSSKLDRELFNVLHLVTFHVMADMRISYDQTALREDSLIAKEPIAQFQNWFDVARQNREILEPNAVCLATAAQNGWPSCRMVLLKAFGKDGFTFFTNYDSRKGRELAENPFAALTFFWAPLHRQVRIEGAVRKVSDVESIRYFNSRPRDSQIAAVASAQSSRINGKAELEREFSLLSEKYSVESAIIPKPENWGGYLVVPEKIEFWQGQKNRMHDRIRFRKPTPSDVIDNKFIHAGDDGWIFERLSP
uniref:pyridoxal 5'-phosphate synthase n=1 Tax=Strigamia maritima TaxID=126957 RepID=T1J8D0_STRMM